MPSGSKKTAQTKVGKPAKKMASSPAQAKPARAKAPSPTTATADEVLASLKKLGSKRLRDDMGKRYGITGPSAEQAFGVSMSNIKQLGKRLGRSHALAAALWETGNYEARMLASFVDEPSEVTPAQMERWVKDFDNWAYCDALSFNLFDRTPHAFAKVAQWAGSEKEFVKRTAFALLWSLALHEKRPDDAPFLRCLPIVERAATDDRNFVKKAVSMALRAVGRRSPALNRESTAVATRLMASTNDTARWVGKDSIKDLTKYR